MRARLGRRFRDVLAGDGATDVEQNVRLLVEAAIEEFRLLAERLVEETEGDAGDVGPKRSDEPRADGPDAIRAAVVPAYRSGREPTGAGYRIIDALRGFGGAVPRRTLVQRLRPEGEWTAKDRDRIDNTTLSALRRLVADGVVVLTSDKRVLLREGEDAGVAPPAPSLRTRKRPMHLPVLRGTGRKGSGHDS